MGYQVQDTTRASLLNSIVDLITQPFTSPTPPQRIPENTQPGYYPEPMYEYQTTPITQRPQTIYYTQKPQKTVKPNYYSRPTYATQPTVSQPPTSSQLPPIVNNIASISDRLNDLDSQCGIPRPWTQNAVSLVVNGNAARKGQV